MSRKASYWQFLLLFNVLPPISGNLIIGSKVSYLILSLLPQFVQNMQDKDPLAHRLSCLKITLSLLAIWFMVSFGAGILLRDWLDVNFPSVGSAPFGFWMAQQGSIIGFILILISYVYLMNRLDRKHGYSEER